VQEINPVGKVQKLENVDNLVKQLVAEWDNEEKPKWWQCWKKGTFLCKATKFVIRALDKLIDAVEDAIPSGADKKATVLAAISVIYDFVVKEAVPIWAKPFAGKIKSLIIDVIISTAIDWIVDKYREGLWNKAPQKEDDDEQKIEIAEDGA